MNLRGIIIAAVASLGVAACSQADQADVVSSTGDVSFVKGDVVLGDANAPLEIIEYASTTCGHCRTFHKTMLPRIKADYIETGKAKMIFRDLPTAPAQLSAAGGALARCAGAESYYATLDDIFTHQYEIFEAARGEGGAMPELIKIGERSGLSADEVRACLRSPEVYAEIERTTELANKDKVSSTPQLIVNGENAGEALRSYEQLQAFLDEKLGIEPAPAEASTEDGAADASEPSEG